MSEGAVGEVTQEQAGDVEALARAIAARLHGGTGAARSVRVSEAALAADFAAQGPGEFEGDDGPRAARDADARAVKNWLARVCREHDLSCSYDAATASYVFRRAPRRS